MNTLDYLRAHEHKSDGGFVEGAQYLQDNWPWLKYSYAIAIKVRHRMRDLGMTQKQLAESIGCSQQHISILLNGRVNMTLETVSKLEKALDFDLVGEALLSFNLDSVPSEPLYLNDSLGKHFDGQTNTRHLVAGYKPRKKKGPKH